MINPKQRAFLKSLAHNMEPVMNIGKYGVNDETIRQLDLALEKRELIKIKILNNNLDDNKEIVDLVLEQNLFNILEINSLSIEEKEKMKIE